MKHPPYKLPKRLRQALIKDIVTTELDMARDCGWDMDLREILLNGHRGYNHYTNPELVAHRLELEGCANIEAYKAQCKKDKGLKCDTIEKVILILKALDAKQRIKNGKSTWIRKKN